MNENVVSIPQAREDIYHQRLNLIRNCYGDLFDAEFVARASLTSATAPPNLQKEAKRIQIEMEYAHEECTEAEELEDCPCRIAQAYRFAKSIRLTSATEGERDWIRVDDYLPDPLEDVDVVIVRFSAGKFVDQWSQIASRRPDGMWIDDDGLVERSDDADYRVITHWAKRIPLPMSECPCHYGQDGCCAFCLKMHAKQKDKSQ